ncbi:hypothetical protein AVEN_149006-1 [Araneus ventricosus]|uniref:Uncharacterized protein n=1 Tax=Araneus ventricosus TaxID=182803 RepID=A0A4Y1ZKL9_ARAVE|nr:hypothetical protein AVEN_149006-1 [Araneus ventricosus]
MAHKPFKHGKRPAVLLIAKILLLHGLGPLELWVIMHIVYSWMLYAQVSISGTLTWWAISTYGIGWYRWLVGYAAFLMNSPILSAGVGMLMLEQIAQPDGSTKRKSVQFPFQIFHSLCPYGRIFGVLWVQVDILRSPHPVLRSQSPGDLKFSITFYSEYWRFSTCASSLVPTAFSSGVVVSTMPAVFLF